MLLPTGTLYLETLSFEPLARLRPSNVNRGKNANLFIISRMFQLHKKYVR